MTPIIKASTTIESGHWLIFTRNGKGMLEDTSVDFVQAKTIRHVSNSEVGLSLTVGENTKGGTDTKNSRIHIRRSC